MAHNHAHAHQHHHQGTGNIRVAFWINTAFAVLEIAGGLYTNSVAILSDALHDFGDSLSLGTAWYFQRKSSQGRDKQYTYGYRRFSLVGAFVNAVVLIIGSIFVIEESVGRLTTPEQPDARGMLIFALIGIAANGVAMLRLRKGQSINERVVSLHFLEDVLGWVAVLIGSVVMMFGDFPIVDPLLSLGIAAFILFNVYRSLKASFQIILQGAPEDVPQALVRKKLESFAEIRNIHDVRMWTMDGHFNVITMHITIDKNLSLEQVEDLKRRVKKELSALNLQHATLEFELEGYHCHDCDNDHDSSAA